MLKLITKSFFIFFIFISVNSCKTNLTSSQLLEKAIKYHDPNGNWSTFNGQLDISMETPNNSVRNSTIRINLPKESFYVKTSKDTLITEYIIEKDSCNIALNGKTNLTDEILKANNLNCERAKLFKNYYTYLYGLPMKLKDSGTHIHDKIEQKTFQNKNYLVLKATYDEAVGSDIWYFYFNPKTYAMEVYQFFKTDKKGNLKPDSGEYILLTEEKTINAIKMPKNRAWYYNKDDGYLGTDILN